MTAPKQKENESDDSYLKRLDIWKQERKEYKKKWNQSKKQHMREYNKNWISDNTQRHKETSEHYRKVNAAAISQKVIKWQRENPEKYAEKSSRYFKNNKDKVLARVVKRRTKQSKSAICENSDRIYHKLRRYASILCGSKEVDHIIPLNGQNVSGLHYLINFCLLEKSVNRAKGNKFDGELWATLNVKYTHSKAARLYAKILTTDTSLGHASDPFP